MKAISLLLLALLTGCVANRIQTSTDDPIPVFTRVLIVSKITHTSPNYLDQYLNLFPKNYEVCTVDIGPLAFGSADSLVREKIRQCNSQVVLTLNTGQNYQGGSGKTAYNANDMLLE
ncbi:MAG: hypothetical protein EOO39_41345, partial [Cytophagaceae bacterium]